MKSTTANSRSMRIAVLGAGKMGAIIAAALLERGVVERTNLRATTHGAEHARRQSQQLGIAVGTKNRTAARDADCVLVCVKPTAVQRVLEEIREVLKPDCLVISIAASVTLARLEAALARPIAVIRAMPNTPVQIGCGMTALCAGSQTEARHCELAAKLFSAVGRTVLVAEKLMDAVTGLSASGPAYIYTILEALADGGVKVGLPREVATLLAAQTALGAARMVLETNQHPAVLKDAVTTPAGCTVDGLMELEEGKLRSALIRAVMKAAQRSRELVQDAQPAKSAAPVAIRA